MDEHTAYDQEPKEPTGTLPALSASQEELLKTFESLSARIPRDRNGFPTYLLDHSHLPTDILKRPETKQLELIEVAKIPLSLLEGYLSFNFNVPVWERLPHEPESFYSAFSAYLNMPIRSPYELGNQLPAMSSTTMHEAYILYYWDERARAYDLLRPVAAAKLRDQRVLMAEDTHFQFSTKVLNLLGAELTTRTTENQNNRPFEGMTAKHLIEAVADMVEMQRIALRLPAKGPRTFGDELAIPEHASINRSMQEAVKMHDGSEGETSKAGEMRKKVEAAIASDPEKAAELQEAALAVLMTVNEKAQAANHANHDD